jgi:hypothetical protein
MKYGKFKVTNKGLVEIPDKPIKVKTGGKTFTIKPDNSFYNTILMYDKQFKKLDPETEIEIDQDDKGIPSLLDR